MPMKNEISPLEELRQEKEIVRREIKVYEDRLAEKWEYLSDNAPSLLFNAALSGIIGWFGFGNKVESKDKKEGMGSSGITHSLLSGLMAYYPLIWDIAKPMLWKYAVRKVISLFTSKKKKGKKDND